MAINSVISSAYDLRQPLMMQALHHELVMDDENGDLFAVSVTDGGSAADLSGASVNAYFIRADGYTVPITGSVSGGTVQVLLPTSCYIKPGRFTLTIKITKGTTRHAIYCAEGVVRRSTTDALIDPEGTVPSLDALLAQIAVIENAVKAAEDALALAQEFADLTVTATTLPTGQPATASYKDGVLTLGLPKGETGSASPIKVNGVEAVGSNITLTAENIPMGDSSVAKKVRMAGAHSLLDNGDFRINQRGESSYTVNGYTVDRWRTRSASAAVTVSSAGITPGVPLRQYVDGDTSGAMTLAVCDGDGVVHVASGNLADGAIVGDTMQLATDDTGVYFLLSSGKTYRWAALYRGEYTADTLPEFVPKGYEAELLACQRYYIRVKTFQVAGQTFTTGARFGFALPMPMRITPTMTLLENGTIICNGVKDVAVTGATVVGIFGNRIKISTEHASQSGWSLQTGTWLNGEFELSADL